MFPLCLLWALSVLSPSSFTAQVKIVDDSFSQFTTFLCFLFFFKEGGNSYIFIVITYYPLTYSRQWKNRRMNWGKQPPLCKIMKVGITFVPCYIQGWLLRLGTQRQNLQISQPNPSASQCSPVVPAQLSAVHETQRVQRICSHRPATLVYGCETQLSSCT